MNQKGHLLGALLPVWFASRYSFQRVIEYIFVAFGFMLFRKLIELAELAGFFEAEVFTA